ncbi:hypothetical protein [Oleiagrimonas sp. C23AA]|uniref:hypothetical protein n=1 Tax=Oleiagrimonas sp. C23AA TaxID=2719047 RepID=UPI001421A3D2|nr:hypothetical protein [Oleiagrimonas sp. C23AA]NII11571.1 hypothetical protein [Oleiagrimonas sp. C23AA]
MNHADRDFQARARRLYRQAAADVDTATAARLRAARREALVGESATRRHGWMMPAGALAVTALALIVAWQPLHRATSPGSPAAAVTSAPGTADSDLPPDPDDADPAMYQDMGFYAWLAHQPPTTTR